MTTARRPVRGLGVLLATLLALPALGCPDWVNVTTPDIIAPGAVSNSDGAIAAYNGAIGAFAFANDGDNGGTEGQILVSGVTSDEYADVETFPTRIEYDSRNITDGNGTLSAVFFNLSQARVAAEHAAAALEQFAPAPDARIGEMFALSGFAYVYFAENYAPCVPIDERLASGTLQFGTPLTTNQLLDSAIARFDSALTHDSGSVVLNVTNLANLGLARALLDQGNKPAAAAAAALVPTGFRYFITHSAGTGREQNGVFVFNNQAPLGTQRFGVADLEGTVGLNFRTAADPRVVSAANGKGFDNIDTLYVLLQRYTSNASPTQVGTGVEARLIQAEALGGAPMIVALNTLRADNVNNSTGPNPPTSGNGFNMAPLADPGTVNGQVDLLFRERAFWLFGTGHRLGDLRRLVRQYARAVNTVYPNGAYFKGAPPLFGTSTELPVPGTEKNNPNFTGCDYTTP